MADTWFDGDSTVKRGRFGKPVKPDLTTEAVIAKVEKINAVKKASVKKPTAKKVPKPKKVAVMTHDDRI